MSNSKRPGLNAIQINAAREIHQLTVSSRIPSSARPQGTNTTTATKVVVGDNKLPTVPHRELSCDAPVQQQESSSIPIQRTPSIKINDNWCIFTQRKPILNATEIEQFESILDIPVPEMIFGNNNVELVHTADSGEVKFHINFNPLDALKLVERNPSDLIKVSYANDWFKSRYLKHSKSDNVTMEVYKPYDWTYSSVYSGTCKVGGGLWKVDNDREIPIDKLTSDNPILFYDDMILYEDELGDNGISILNVKIRVMKNCLLILQRLFIRVDDVLVRVFDTRLYVDFDTNEIIREFKIQQDDYQSVLLKTKGQPDPKKPLRDIQWCSQILPVKSISREVITSL